MHLIVSSPAAPAAHNVPSGSQPGGGVVHCRQPMPAYLDIDLHGVPPDDARVAALLRKGALEARRKHLGLRIIHGRGEHVMADIAQGWLRNHELPFQEGVLNPGETRVEALALQRTRRL